ncbi:MAG: carboxypeptidase M32 [Treponema sp.]|jgi:carboxypeptidase Taq|nr:carboxypeptidase M32 [Treponema sp.]
MVKKADIMDNGEKVLEEFRAYMRGTAEYRRVNGLLFWDSMLRVPPGGAQGRARTRAFMAKEQFARETGGEVRRFLRLLEPREAELSDFDRALLRLCRRDYDINASIPVELFEEYERIKAESMAGWDLAYKANNYTLFAPHLKRIMETQKKICPYYTQGSGNYDKLIQLYEEDVDTALLDSLFAELKETILPLVQKITAQKRPRPEFLSRPVPAAVQRRFCEQICRRIGLDEDKAMLYETTHPFSCVINTGDIRFSTRYREEDFQSSLFSTLHEGGHSIYSLNIPETLGETILGEGASPAFHEGQSRFYENVIGRSREFISYIYPDIEKFLGPHIGSVGPDELYRGFNHVAPSFIRTEADELTYTLHIILRYELERACIDQDMAVEDLPEAWNKKMKEYFNLEVSQDRLGLLQDIQWSAGRIGAFVSYALGNVYNAQIFHTIKKDMDFAGALSRGDFAAINGYLKEKVHCYSALYPPRRQLRMISGSDPDSVFFTRYLVEKYTALYDL